MRFSQFCCFPKLSCRPKFAHIRIDLKISSICGHERRDWSNDKCSVHPMYGAVQQDSIDAPEPCSVTHLWRAQVAQLHIDLGTAPVHAAQHRERKIWVPDVCEISNVKSSSTSWEAKSL
mmetsp:Transcript_28073/g.63547  ORF Transcript_28073/g.63547 Transcript_28073/m.63547 type:complete len:119 (+) Transcript_28073:360-716(+)